MSDLLRSLSTRFYLSLSLAVTALTATAIWGWRAQWGEAVVGATAVGGTVAVGLLLLVPLVALFYRALGVLRPPPLEPQPSSPSRPSGPSPASSPPSEGATRGTLRAFLKQDRAPPEVDDTELRIGIVLSGGGAKGVYQAGALHAVRDFLSGQGALPHVRALAGTSIGTWNAMFWLTDQVADGVLRDWWCSVRPPHLVEPSFYVPYVRNYLLHNDPWRRSFERLFGASASELTEARSPYYYFTRTNVEEARLEVTTNRGPEYRYYCQTPTGYEPVAPVVNEGAGRHRVRDFSDLERSVFASMDLPPAFPRIRGPGGDLVEDGGVIDNLPIRYTTRYEGCNLLFVLPLNATFQQEASRRSVARRLLRVMEIRQGALERTALRDISLYNQVIVAADRARHRPGTGKEAFPYLEDIHVKPVTTFCVAPSPELTAIGTVEFWELRDGAGAAYDRMYEATRRQLDRFDFSVENRDVRMTAIPADEREEATHRDFTLR